ncbi:37S ribosomal protein YMR-31, mitochondrial [Pseudocercospora fuligena]|uniref:37S ribosomal protein YMR-31, mitochondrial n=1 Tax=Pseudocercospora fuligena TaxID=685502 RepID=A0A8H6RMA0_9PEZI|nr:37S ribosomal protein YMR-31, mitochondrial [Pseudocercospora fuligena]
MQATRRLWQHRQPMIRFLGKRQLPKQVDHSPKPHPESPSHDLPQSFAKYREQAIQHGPLKGGQPRQAAPSGGASGPAPMNPYGSIGGKSAKELGPIKPGKGEFADRNELPARFRRVPWSTAEIEAIESGGASMFG